MVSWINLGIIASLAWGIYVVILKKVTSEQHYRVPPSVAFFAMSLGILITSLASFFVGGSLTSLSIPGVGISVVAGLLWGIGMSSVTYSLSLPETTVSKLTPLYNTNTLVAVILAILLLKEVPGQIVLVLLGAALVVLGAILVTRKAPPSIPGDTQSPTMLFHIGGHAILGVRTWVVHGIVTSLVWGAYALLLKVSTSADYYGTNLFVAFAAMSLGILLISGGMFAKERKRQATLSKRGVFYALLSGIIWGIGLLAVIYALSSLQTPVAKLVPLYNTNTLVAVFLGMFFLHEVPRGRWITILGAILIVAGGALVTIP